MNFRRHAKPEIFGFQIAPMVDILLVLLVFFIVTWNVSISERELDVKIPAASHSKENNPMIGEVIVNVRKDGAIIFNQQQIDHDELVAKLQELAKLYPDQAVIVRGDERTPYTYIMNVMDICREANIWNIVFAAAAASTN